MSGTAVSRKEGIIRGLAGGVIGLVLFLFRHQSLALIAWSLSGITLLAVLLSPHRAYRAIHRGLNTLSRFVGAVLGWILLPLFFFGFVLVFGILARRGKRDRLLRRFEKDAVSYWTDRNDPPRDGAFYERQF